MNHWLFWFWRFCGLLEWLDYTFTQKAHFFEQLIFAWPFLSYENYQFSLTPTHLVQQKFHEKETIFFDQFIWKLKTKALPNTLIFYKDRNISLRYICINMSYAIWRPKKCICSQLLDTNKLVCSLNRKATYHITYTTVKPLMI